MANKTSGNKPTNKPTSPTKGRNAGLTGRQQVKVVKAQNKRDMNMAKAGVAAIGEITAGRTAQKNAEEAEKTKREGMRQKTYQAALDKWNGIINNTSEPAEGAGQPAQGTTSGNKEHPNGFDLNGIG